MKITDIAGLSVKNGHLCMDGRDVTELAATYGSPLYIGSEKRIEENVKEVKETFCKYHLHTAVHYAAKAETSLATLEIVRAAGAGLEVNSGGELYKGLRAGYTGAEIVFNGVAKSEKEQKEAISNEVKAINVDSPCELKRIAKVAKACGKRANVLFRIVPDVASGVAKAVETGTCECKFGTMPEDIPDMIAFAKQEKEWICLRGFHLHIGTQTFHLESFIDSFRVLLDFCIKMKEETGFVPEILDIGGGLPVPYFIDAPAGQYMSPNLYQMLRGNLKIEEIAKAVTGELHGYQGFFKDCELLIEPGRKIVADAFLIVSRVENRKIRHSMNEEWLMLDAGMNVLIDNSHWYFPMVCANKADEVHCKPVKIGGPLCESGDVWLDYENHRELPDYRMMPESIDIEDYVAILETGAYGTPLMNHYNGRPAAGVILLKKDGTLMVAKRPETYEDLLSGEEDI